MSKQQISPEQADLLKGLNPAQEEAVLHDRGPLLIVAGAGSGKTAVLTRRVAYLLGEKRVSPWAVLAITFTNKAANELKERVAGLVGPVANKMSIGTFHSACVRILRKEAPRLGYRSAFTIYDTGDTERLIGFIMREGDMDTKKLKPSAVHHAISAAKDELIGPEKYETFATNWMEKQISSVYTVYQKRLKEASAMDFDDLINKTVEVFQSFPDVLAEYRQRFQHILVDEFQDTNGAQFELVRLLGAPDGDVCVVGDMDQSVYSFRGADYRNLGRFEEAFPGAKVITLEQNYRSSQRILSAANALIEFNVARKPKNLWTDQGMGEMIIRYHAEDEHDEAAFVAAEIERLKGSDGIQHRDVAIFYRTNAQSRVVEEVFTRFGIPYRIVGGLRFYERKEVKDILAYLKVTVNPSDRVSVRRVVNTPRRGIGDKTIAELEGYAAAGGNTLYEAMEGARHLPGMSRRALAGIEEFVQVIGVLKTLVAEGASLRSIVEAAAANSGYLAELKADRSLEALGRVENVEELGGVATEYAERFPEGTLEDFLAQISLVSEIDEYNEAESSVPLMTLHNAKGLEFPIVFILGMEEGVFPHMRSLGEPAELEEERRLAYVGITRAKERLYLTHAWNRSLWGGASYNPPSRFLKEIPEDLIKMVGETPGTSIVSGTARYPNLERATTGWKVGQEVQHERWGTGVITSLSGQGERAEASIWFSDVGEKRLMLAYAPIKPTS
ncbi:MAG TPA: DNA helicase PcrA [Actinomycetota bacterium]|nr:DNA helicase PcrA [Actinomycetota bacterium]